MLGNFFILFICLFSPNPLLPTSCLVPGHLTAVYESCASQLSKHSMLNDSPECVLLCWSLPHPLVRDCALVSLLLYRK